MEFHVCLKKIQVEKRKSFSEILVFNYCYLRMFGQLTQNAQFHKISSLIPKMFADFDF